MVDDIFALCLPNVVRDANNQLVHQITKCSKDCFAAYFVNPPDCLFPILISAIACVLYIVTMFMVSRYVAE